MRQRRGAGVPQPCRVAVVIGLPEEDLQVPEHVRGQEQQEDDPGHGHDGLLADRRAVQA
jgi:hypothetical protein